MKNLIVILFVYILLIINCYAQWGQDVRLTYNPATSTTSYNNARCIASNGNIVNVVWCDDRDGDLDIYFKRSEDGGLNWGPDLFLTDNTAVSLYPCIAMSGQLVIVFFCDNGGGTYNVWRKRSTNGGISWLQDNYIPSGGFNDLNPSASISGQTVHVAWEENHNNPSDINYCRSFNGGISFEPILDLTNNPSSSLCPSLDAYGQNVYVVWEDLQSSNSEIYFRCSTNEGSFWKLALQLTNNIGESRLPSVSVYGQDVHVVWQNYSSGNFNILYKHSTDEGISWGENTYLSSGVYNKTFASILSSGSLIHVVWVDSRDGNSEIYYKRSANRGITWGTDVRLTNYPFESICPSISVSGSMLHVVWTDYRDGNSEIYYKNELTGNFVDINYISSHIPKHFSLSQNYPNPFNPSTKIKFSIPLDSRLRGNDNVVLKVYDALGREVQTLVNEHLQPGTYEVDFDGSNFSSGVYYYTISAGNYYETKKMVLLK